MDSGYLHGHQKSRSRDAAWYDLAIIVVAGPVHELGRRVCTFAAGSIPQAGGADSDTAVLAESPIAEPASAWQSGPKA